MLRSTQAEICLSCHDKPVKTADNRVIASMASLSTSPVVHGAVNHGDCSACHSVHGGTLKNLLVAVNTAFPHGQYDRRKYALCFSCHDARLAESAARTQFRDGDTNLHEAHLRTGERSIGCGACHAVHDAELPRLIAKAVRFEGSTWAMPMSFSLTADGGTCASACHETLEYNRNPGGVRAARNGGAR
jgi:predicted CXXCH cytochrome family protein